MTTTNMETKHDDNLTYDYELLNRTYVKGFSIEINEKCDIDKLELIVNNFYDISDIGVFRNLSDGSYSKLDKDSTLTVLRNMLVEKRKTDKVVYKFPTYNSNGRLFSKTPSSQNCNRKIRHTLYKDYYYDCDMVSAHNTICVWYCKKFGITCDRLEYYIKNKDKCLRQLQKIYSIDKEQAKEGILSLINGGNPPFDDKLAPKWLVNLAAQMQLVLDIISNNNPSIVEKIKKKLKNNNLREFNVKGKVANTIYCEIENNLLLLIKQFIINVKGKKIGSLVFDGFFLDKEGITKEECEEILTEAEEYVLEKSGFPLKLVIKDMDEYIDLTDFVKEVLDDKSSVGSGTKLKKTRFPNPLYLNLGDYPVCEELDLYDFNEWNKTVMKITSILDIIELFTNTVYEVQNSCYKSHFITVTKKYNKMFDAYFDDIKTFNNGLLLPSSPLVKSTILKNDISLMKFWGKQFSEEDIYIKVPLINIFRDLYEEGLLQIYNSYKFEPYPYDLIEKDNNKYKDFNLFRGFKAAVDNKYLLNIDVATSNFEKSLMYKHITQILCDNDPDVYNYVLSFIAHIIQHPQDLAGVIMLFISIQGVGKDLFFQFLSKLVGVEYCLGYDNYSNFFKDFNCEKERVLITCLNEINDGGSAKDSSMFKNHNHLKGIITGETLRIEGKGKEAYRVNHYSRYIAFSQFENCVNVEHSDRRTVMIKCSAKYANNPKYFTPLIDYLNDSDNIKTAFAYFAHKDLTTYSPRVFPTTELRKKQQENCLGTSLQFVKHLWVTYELPNEFRIQYDHLYQIYLDYCKHNNAKDNSSKIFFKHIDDFGFCKSKDETLKIDSFMYNAKNDDDAAVLKVLRDISSNVVNKKRVGYRIKLSVIEDLFKTYFRRDEFVIEKI